MQGIAPRVRAMVWIVCFACLWSVAAGTVASHGRVSVLYTGDPYPGVSPYLLMKEDASLSVTPVQASPGHYGGISHEDILRAIRVYMPRTFADYVDKYDAVILSDSDRFAFTQEQIAWFGQGVLEGGLGLLMVGGFESFGGSAGYPSWEGSPVDEVLPVQSIFAAWIGGGYNYPIVITEDGYRNEFIASLPFKPLPKYMVLGTEGNIVGLKPGSLVLARWDSARFQDPPCYVFWEVGSGRTFAMMHDWTPAGGTEMSRWEYYQDFAVNMMLYVSGRALPSDPAIVHDYRQRAHALAARKESLLALISFVDSFGGNPRPIDEKVGVLDSLISEMETSYLDQEFAKALEKTDVVASMMVQVEELAVRVKNTALAWVYMIEWLSVTATTLFSGTVLWTLMVRRTMYRETRATRGGRSQ